MRPNDEMPDVLQRIVAAKREELRRRMREAPPAEIRKQAEQTPSGRSFADALREGSSRLRLIAEVKMASPSAGLLMDDEKRARLPVLYAENGAAAISVLTERDHFQGSLQHLADAKEVLRNRFGEATPPLLRKDFLFDLYHVWESKAAGAAAILLIVAVLSDGLLADMLSLAHGLGLDCLLETHDEREVERAVASGAEVIGINNRDLRTFEVDLATTERLRPLIPDGRVVVAESGIRALEDARRLAECDVHAILVGEALITARDPAAKMRELML